MEGKELKHSFHNHMLTLKAEQSKINDGDDHPEAYIKCSGCSMLISGPFYSCGDCQYFLHKICAELPSELDYPLHPEHPLALLECSPYRHNYYYCNSCGEKRSQFVYHCSECSFYLDMTCASATHKMKDKCHPHPLTPLQVPIAFVCHICRKKDKGLSYKCYSCPFWVHQNCTLLADTVDHSHLDHPYPFIQLQHVFHNHTLTLLANEFKTELKTEDGIDNLNVKIKCNGCRTEILGPFYCCGECRYFLHKVCAELPSALGHPLHPQHSLTLLKNDDYRVQCSLCGERIENGVMCYNCTECLLYVDMKCASAAPMIRDKCHPHPLISLQVPIAFTCHICMKEEEGLSYKCSVCPFWVHQNCTLVPDEVKCSDHPHLLTLLPSVPLKYKKRSQKCDICHATLFMFQSTYSCTRCLFFSHVSCARSETMQSPSTSRDQNTDGQSLMCLPVNQDSTDFISRFVRNYIEGDADKDDKIDHFNHEHPLFLIDEETTDKTCEACAIRISAPSYGCVDCDYFLHKCCTDLPKQIRHPLHPEHQLVLWDRPDCIPCYCCFQYCNSFTYDCSDCSGYVSLDIKCALLQGTVYHEGHKHHLSALLQGTVANSVMTCTACGWNSYYILKCNTCRFVLCFRCAMAPRVIKHRYGKSEPFKLKYSPFENHDDEYICEICLGDLNPKRWFYHCVYDDQFAHMRCMLEAGACSNIKFGKSQMYDDRHEHKLTTISCTYDYNRCNECGEPMRRNMCSGTSSCLWHVLSHFLLMNGVVLYPIDITHVVFQTYSGVHMP